MKFLISSIIAVALLLSCGSSKQLSELDRAQSQRVKDQVENGSLSVLATWAYPLANNTLNALGVNNGLGNGNTGNRINLIGNNNYFFMERDSVSAYLPYFGERWVGGGYNSSNAVTFAGIPQDLKVSYNEKKNCSEIQFTISDTAESYDVYLDVFYNERVRISVNSTHRTSIRYDGILEKEAE